MPKETQILRPLRSGLFRAGTTSLNRNYSTQPRIVTSTMMCDLEDWNGDDSVVLGLATKPGYPNPNFPIKHSAIALHNPKQTEEKSYVIIGRQVTEGFNLSSLLFNSSRVKTEKVNEKTFLDPRVDFTVYPTAVSFSKNEVMNFLEKAEEVI